MLKFVTKKFKASTMLDEAIVPALGKSVNVQNTQKSLIDDYQGLFIGFGKRDTCYPYREQNAYTETEYKDLNVAILENDYLYAEYLVDFGGRLWKLYNKKSGKDLLYTNDVVRFRNLSLRNAWFSGGVEWNIGIIGHTAYTCDRLYTAKVKGKGGEDVLRFYEFERVREVYYQMDFWLETDKLMARMRITNPSEDVVPMYWWSNIATPEFKNGRFAVDAKIAFNNSDGRGIAQSTIPIETDGRDVSHYENIMDTIDYFFDIPWHANKFIANFDSEGNGLLQTSSAKLQGRKLFSWGHTQGSRRWQDMLTDNAGDYVEIQAGLGKTQYECIPMPPKTSWNWLEVYTDITMPKETVAGDYDELVSCVNDRIKDKLCVKALDARCEKTLGDIALVRGELVFKGSGYGYVKDCAEHNAPEHLEFFVCENSSKYLSLLQDGECSSDIKNQTAFAQEKYQIKALEEAVAKGSENWNIYYQLAVYKAYCKDFQESYNLCAKSMTFDNNYLNNHLMAFIMVGLEKSGDYFARRTIQLCQDNYSVAESILKMFLDTEKWFSVKETYECLSEKLKATDRLKLYYALSLLKLGNAHDAENIMESGKGLQILDYREGEKSLNDLYKGIRVAKYGEKLEDIIVPSKFDFVVVENYKK